MPMTPPPQSGPLGGWSRAKWYWLAAPHRGIIGALRQRRHTSEDVVAPIYGVKRDAAGYRRGDDRAVPVPELDAPAREIGKGQPIIHEHLALDRPGPCATEFTQPGGGSTGQPEASTVVPGRVLGIVEIVGHPILIASGGGGWVVHSPLWRAAAPSRAILVAQAVVAWIWDVWLPCPDQRS